MEDVWKDIPGYEGRYQISNRGHVRSMLDNFGRPKNIIRKAIDNGHGYFYVMLKIKGKHKNHYIHRLVANAFVKNNNPNAKEINHIDGDKSNNCPANLEWVTSSENTQHGIRTGLIPQPPGRNCMAINKETGHIITSERVSDLARMLSVRRDTIAHILRSGRHGNFKYEVVYA